MIKKGIMWFLVLSFLNFIIVPDYVFADDAMIDRDKATPYVVGAVVVLGLIIFGIVKLAKHSKSPTPTESPTPAEQPKDTTKISPVTNLDEQLITPTGELILARW